MANPEEAPGPQLLPGRTLAIVVMWVVGWRMEDPCLSLSISVPTIFKYRIGAGIAAQPAVPAPQRGASRSPNCSTLVQFLAIVPGKAVLGPCTDMRDLGEAPASSLVQPYSELKPS